MKKLPLLLLVPMLAFSVSSQAQECSGGADGGMDATGNQCNRPEVADDRLVLRIQGLEAYTRGHYDAAVELFRRAAERGDLHSATIIVLMHRYNAQLYGGQVSVGAPEARHWGGVVARATQVTDAKRIAVRP